MRQSSREMCAALPPRNRKDFAAWERDQLAAYNAAEKLGDRSIADVVTIADSKPVERVERAPPVVEPVAAVSRPVRSVRAPMKLAAYGQPRAKSITMDSEQANATSGRMTIYGYCRVSTIAQADEGESLGVQERQIKGWAMMRGEDVADIIVERGVSGSVPVSKRPEGGRLWKLAKRGDTIVVARLDRLFRSALDALQSVEECQRRGVSLVVIDGLGEITGNGMAKAFLTISAAFAELERDTIRERVSTVKADQKTRGRYLGGKVPFGFVVGEAGELVEVAEEQAMIEVARSMRRDGKPLRAIQSAIEANHGRRISLEALSRITG